MIKQVSLILIFFTSTISAENLIPKIFSDNMVLQRNMEVPIWGWTKPGSKVSVNFAGQVKRVTAGKDGKWFLKLDKMTASKAPKDMKIDAAGKVKIIKNILIGEVWLCSGQSNMQEHLANCSKPSIGKQYRSIPWAIKKEMNNASDPLLRQIAIGRVCSPFKGAKDVTGKWIESQPKANAFFSGVGYFFAKELRKKLDVPVGLVVAAWGATRIQPWIPKNAFNTDPKMQEYYNLISGQKQKLQNNFDHSKVKKFEESLKKITDPAKRKIFEKKRPKEPIMSKELPATIYNGMIHPIIPYAIKGTIWYQGESNRKHYADEYGKHFSAMIKSWRQNWGQGDFPFYFVQLASFRKPSSKPLENDTSATICNQQRLTLSVKNTGMAVANDIGEIEDIHPRNKIDVGKRLSLWALAKDYGFKEVVYSGPLYKSSKFTGQKVIVSFDHAGAGLMTGEKHLLKPTVEVKGKPLRGFQICGADRKWKWAEAKIISKDSVEVFHPGIKKPIEVRYAWAENPAESNLYNSEGLPTSVFSAVKQ